MTPLLSILIPTVIGREKEFSSLRLSIEGNIHSWRNEIQILWAVDDKEMTIGEKREWLYNNAIGTYSVQVDDDDNLSSEFYYEVRKAIFSKSHYVDCITYREMCFINGFPFTSNHSLKYDDWGERQDGFDYVRTPFMKSVIKTEIARSVPVPHLRFGEDHEWAKALKPHLHTEIHIDKELYFYQHNSKPEDFLTRYGFDRD